MLSEIAAPGAASVISSTLLARPPVPWEQNKYTFLPDRSFCSKKESSAIGTPYHQLGYPKNTVSYWLRFSTFS